MIKVAMQSKEYMKCEDLYRKKKTVTVDIIFHKDILYFRRTDVCIKVVNDMK